MKPLPHLFTSLLLIALLICVSQAATPPVLPQRLINTAYQPPTGGQRHIVTTTTEFKAALIAAKLGDIIELKAGNTFVGPFDLPKKPNGAGWIYIISSDYDKLPLPSHRVSPADASAMPKLVVAAGGGGTVNASHGAHHYRFVGIEFMPKPGNFTYNVIQIGAGETTEADQPHDLVFDRCYIHGDPTAGSRRGVLLNGASLAVIDSYISDCKEDGADSQALAGYSSTGPIKIVNNHLEGAGENVIFGGADPSIPNAVPSDIEIRCNHFFKPLSWQGNVWDVKNLFELKNAQRVLVEGNLFENCWPDAQSGHAVVLTPRNQNNTAPWSVVQDVTIRHNTFVNIAQGINIAGHDAPNISQRTSRILIQNNVWTLAKNGPGSDGRLFMLLGGPTDVTFDHNTGFTIISYMVADGSPKMDFLSFKNNLVTHGYYGFIGTGTANANTTLAMWFNNNWEVTHNADIGGSAQNYPTGNFFPANVAAVQFVDSASGNYRLQSSSPYKNLGTDGKDLGANLDTIAKYSTYTGDDTPQSTVALTKPFEEMEVYPLPANDFLHIRTNRADWINLMVSDMLGRCVISSRLTSGAAELNVRNLPSGIYQISAGPIFKKIVIDHSH